MKQSNQNPNSNNGGFTLAELLGVITLLAILAIIVIPAIEKTLKEGKDDLYISQIKSIESSAKMWGTDHLDSLPNKDESITIILQTLQQDGYIAEDIENPKTEEPFDPNLQIRITNHGNYYTYKVIEE